jgi:nitrogen regulatory protein PII
MNTKTGITVVTALIRPQMEGHVVRALHDLEDFPGFFIAAVRGQGRGRGAGGSYQATEFDLTYHAFLQLQIVCGSDMADEVCRIIAIAAWTGRKGDGVVFTTGANSFMRIREVGGPQHEVST